MYNTISVCTSKTNHGPFYCNIRFLLKMHWEEVYIINDEFGILMNQRLFCYVKYIRVKHHSTPSWWLTKILINVSIIKKAHFETILH